MNGELSDVGAGEMLTRPHDALGELVSGADQHTGSIFSQLLVWLEELQAIVVAQGKAIKVIQAALRALVGDDDTALTARIAAIEQFDAATTAQLATISTNLRTVTDSLNTLQAQLTAPASFTVSIDTERDPLTMAFQIADNDTSHTASVEIDDALGFPTSDPGVTIAFASSDPSVLTVDATSGAVTPVAPGAAQVQATVTNADGSSLTGTPADVEIIPGPAATFKVSVG